VTAGARPPGLDAPPTRLGLTPGARGELAGTLGPLDARQVKLVIGIIGALLLIVCVNVATLLFAGAASRRREIAVRLSIGAGPRRVLRQLLTESVLLAVLGGAASFVVARIAGDVLLHVLPIQSPPVDGGTAARALMFTVGISVLVGLLIGMAPASAARRMDVSPVLKSPVADWMPGGKRLAGKTLVVAQVALSIGLLTATGLLMRSLDRLYAVDTGIDADHVLSAGVYPVLVRYDHVRELVLYRRLLDALAATPGVETAALSRYAIDRDGVNFVAPRVFATLGRPIVRGRDITDVDVSAGARVAVVNETAVHQFYPGVDPIGRFVPPAASQQLGTLQIVGVAGDITTSYRHPQNRPAVFVPYTLAPPEELGQADIFVRTRESAAPMAQRIRETVRSVDPDLALLNLEPLAREFDRSVDPQRSTAALLGVCGVIGLLLVAIGLYGTLAHAVARRTKELGIRMSLGAARSDILAMVLREAAAIVAAGIGIGLLLALAAARALSALLFGVGVIDPLTLSAVAALMAAVALAAAYAPARRAARVDPLVALRYE
jgi:predicted permease